MEGMCCSVAIVLMLVIALHNIECATLVNWIPYNSSLSGQEYYSTSDMLTNDPVVIDLGVNRPVILKLDSRLTDAPNFRISCKIEPLDPNSELNLAQFCKRREGKICQDITKTNINFGNNNRFTSEFSSTHGAEIRPNWNQFFEEQTAADLTAIYYCQFANDKNKLKSASLEIQDVMYKYRGIIKDPIAEVVGIPHIVAADLPMLIKCPTIDIKHLTSDDKHNVQPLIRWKSMKFDNEIKRNLLRQRFTFDREVQDIGQSLRYEIMADGSLRIFEIKLPNVFVIGALVCLHYSDSQKIYGIVGAEGSSLDTILALKIDGQTMFNGPPELVDSHPGPYLVNIREGPRSVRYPLEAVYRHNPRKTGVKWYKDGTLIPTTQDSVELRYRYFLGKSISETKFMITKDMSGKYEIDIRDGSHSLIIRYHVQVQSPPTVVQGDDPKEYCMQNSNFSTKIEFTGAEMVVALFNGYGFDLKDTEVDSVFKPPDLAPTKVLDYSVFKVGKHSSHVLTLEAQSKIGVCRVNKLISVVPLPEFEAFTKAFSCTGLDCKAGEERKFWCPLKKLSRRAINETGAILITEWFVGNQQITEAAKESFHYLKFFTIGEGSLKLHVDESGTEAYNQARDYLQNTEIRCTVKIYDPEFYPPTGPTSPILYSSDSSPPGADMLTASLKMQFEELATGGFMWLYVIIVVVLLLLVAMFIIIWTVTRFSSGHIYNVDQQERAQGIDRDKEAFAKETFHTFERPEDDGPLDSSNHIAHMESCHVELHSNRDESEINELDPRKFNEDGSFIYNYGNKSSTS